MSFNTAEAGLLQRGALPDNTISNQPLDGHDAVLITAETGRVCVRLLSREPQPCQHLRLLCLAP